MDFLFREFDEAFEVALVTVLQQRIEQHGAKRGRERERQARVHAVAQPAVHDLNQRDVGFGDGFKEPVFLQKLVVFRMAHKRQMRVEDEREIALHWAKNQWSFRSVFEQLLQTARQRGAFYQHQQANHKRNGQITDSAQF